MPDTLREWIAPIVTLIGGTGLGAFIQAIRKPSSAAEVADAQARMVLALNEQFKAVTDELRAEIAKLKDETAECHERGEAQEREIGGLRQENAELKDRVKRLEGQLEARDLAAADTLPGTFAVIEGDRKTVMRPPRAKKPRSPQ